MDVVMAPCNGCYHNLKRAEYDLGNDAESREVVDRISKKAGHATYQAGEVRTVRAASSTSAKGSARRTVDTTTPPSGVALPVRFDLP